jgi:hypothetical protein
MAELGIQIKQEKVVADVAALSDDFRPVVCGSLRWWKWWWRWYPRQPARNLYNLNLGIGRVDGEHDQDYDDRTIRIEWGSASD